MRKQTLLAIFALAIAAPAFAADRNDFDSEAILQLPPAQSATGLTREAVTAAFLAARAAGKIPYGA